MDIEVRIVGGGCRDQIRFPSEVIRCRVEVPFRGHRGGDLIPDHEVVGVFHKQEVAFPLEGIGWGNAFALIRAVRHGIIDLRAGEEGKRGSIADTDRLPAKNHIIVGILHAAPDAPLTVFAGTRIDDQWESQAEEIKGAQISSRMRDSMKATTHINDGFFRSVEVGTQQDISEFSAELTSQCLWSIG